MENKIKFGKCPHCNSTEYHEGVSAFVNGYDHPYVIMNAYCKDCGKEFTTYYSQDEVRFDNEDGEEEIYNNVLSKSDKETILRAMNLLIEREEDTEDYTRIINIMNGGLNQE
jgi:transcriptional regulator NrdR family protein